jgi:hypothetical protein
MAELRAALVDAEFKLAIATADLENEKELTAKLIEQVESLAHELTETKGHRSWWDVE